MPRPTGGDIRKGNMLARRAQQLADLEIRYPSIPIDELTFILHSDYSSKETSNMGHTQGGYIIGVTNRDMEKGRVSPWSPSIWRSYRVKRVVKSTLAGESSVMTDGLGHLEWVMCFFAMGFFRGFTLGDRARYLSKFKSLAVIDCKSIYDNVCKMGSPSGIDDKRCAVDISIGKESLRALGLCCGGARRH